jgi:hypothetical protein
MNAVNVSGVLIAGTVMPSGSILLLKEEEWMTSLSFECEPNHAATEHPRLESGFVDGADHTDRIRWIRCDENDKTVAGADNASSEPKGQELSYAARISLDRTQMQIDDNLVNLGMGMAVTVEVKTGERSVLSYLLSPILKYKHEMMRER